MQTFLPFEDFAESARVLDRQRLGKQRVENLQLLNAMVNPDYRMGQHHPARFMWEPYKLTFLTYHAAIINEWHEVRGYKDTTWKKFTDTLGAFLRLNPHEIIVDAPPWLGDPEFHRRHQSNLLRKAHEMTDKQMKFAGIPRDYYDEFFPGVPDNLDYIWPNPITEVV